MQLNFSRTLFKSPCPCGKTHKTLIIQIFVFQLPLQIDIIKHKHEIDGKSTAAHAAILAPDNVTVYEYPNIPDYSKQTGVVLIFPSPNSCSIASLFSESAHLDRSTLANLPKGHNIGTLLKFKLNEIQTGNDQQSKMTRRLPIQRAVFIDSTWNQCRGIYKNPQISGMKSVVLQNRASQFWRHQQGSPRWYLSTIEAIHQFLLEMHCHAWGISRQYLGFVNLELSETFLESIQFVDPTNGEHLKFENSSGSIEVRPYDGQYDNLLFFFTHMYDLIHSYYDHNKLKSYKRPLK